jgi:spermidine/putrescine transport system permease protein
VTFWKVTLPLLLPALVAVGLLAFALSIDDYVITSFVAGATAVRAYDDDGSARTVN